MRLIRSPLRHLLAFLDALSAVVTLGVTPSLMVWRHVPISSGYMVHLVGLALVLLITVSLLLRDGMYSAGRRLSPLVDLMRLCWRAAIASGSVALIAFLTKGFFTGYASPSRLVLGISLCIFLGLGSLWRIGLWAYERTLFIKGSASRRAIVLGCGQAADEFLGFIAKRPWLGIKCVGQLAELVPSLDDLEELDRVIKDTSATEVVVALDPGERGSLPDAIRMLSLARLPFSVVPSLFEEMFVSTDLRQFAALPVVDFAVDPLDRVQRSFKRALDLAVTVIVLALGFPFALAVAAAIKLDSRGPVLYLQERVCKNGKHFYMFKFRTMVKGADKLVHGLQSENETDSEGRLFKMKNDPRITRVGRFLRRWSIDEVPQFLNVLRGEMSLVGPRPPLPREVERYEVEHLFRLRATPGLTGLWQVSGRSNLNFEEMVRLDRHYLEHWSIGLDLLIMLKTVYVVLKREGAY